MGMSKVSLTALILLAITVSTGHSAADNGEVQTVNKESNLFQYLDFFKPQTSVNRVVREPAKDSQKKTKNGNEKKIKRGKTGKKKGSKNVRRRKRKSAKKGR